MGLFKRRIKPSPTRKLVVPVVFIENENDTSIHAMTHTTRFFFTETLIGPSTWEPQTSGRMRLADIQYLPDHDSYMELRQQLGDIVGVSMDSNFIRCYPHYIALQWEQEKQPEERLNESVARIEHEVVRTLGSYFNWEQPVEIGRFFTFEELYDTSRKLGVDWTAGGHK
jgi:hypothetical protein